jgi:Rhamnan synthesis protein F
MTYFVLVFVFIEMPRARLKIGLRLHPGTPLASELWCIFAIAQKTRFSQNLATFLHYLRDAGYNIILINNGSLSPGLISHYLPLCHTIVERPHGGRDFGSYKWGSRWLCDLKRGGQSVTRVIYCNDSIFVRPSALERLLSRLVQMDEDYICITEVFQLHYHVQSWFFAISGRVFDSPAFNQFWHRYTPYSYRRHSINKGEVGISKHLMRNGIYPQALYSHNTILNLVLNKGFDDTLDRLVNFLSPGGLASPSDYNRIMTAIKDSNDTNIALLLLKRNLMERIAQSNTMHATNLLLLKSDTFPFLKKDLVYRAEYFFPQVEYCIQDWTGEDAVHLPEILASFRSRDSLRWVRTPAAILARMGLI